MASASNNEDTLRFANFRLCRLCVWPKYEGLGFNLDASSQPPHLIRLVESHSPAAAGGLKILDVILAVNGRDVSDAFYIDVITAVENARDKSDRIELLVVERRFYDLLKHHHVSFNPKLARKIDTPITMPRDYLNFPKHEPRTCVLRLYRTDRSFGFEVVDGKDAIGSFIQEVDPNSPASKANLRKSDRIIEIDDEFVDDKPSKIILETLAKSKAKHTVKLYVVDTNTYEYFQDNEIPLPSKEYQRSSFANKSSVDPHIRKSRSRITSFEQNKHVQRRLSNADVTSVVKSTRSRSSGSFCSITHNAQPNRRQHQLRLIPGFPGYGVHTHSNQTDGVAHKITQIEANSPAEKSGLRVGDYIVTINNENVEHMDTVKFRQILRISVQNSTEDGTPLLLEVIDESLYRPLTSCC